MRYLARISTILVTITSVVMAKQISVSTVSELTNATKNSVAGDTILVAPGEYQADTTASGDPGNLPNGRGHFWIGANGTAANPIVVMGVDLKNPPVLKGLSVGGGYVFHVTGDYVILKNLIITMGNKGVVFDNSNHSILEDCEIHNAGAELVHVRDGSSNVIISRNKIYNSGTNGTGSIGEGLYVGTDQDRWGADDRPQTEWGAKAISEGFGGYDWRVDSTLVMSNYFSGSISAECMDVKEGTRFTIVKGNMFVGDSIGKKAGGEYYDDSFIDQKGVSGTFIQNKFCNNGNSLTKYISEVSRASFPHVPAELTTDGNSNSWCDVGDADGNIGSASDNEIVTTPVDPRSNTVEFFKFFTGAVSTNLQTSKSSPLFTVRNNHISVRDNGSYALDIFSGDGQLLKHISSTQQIISFSSFGLAKGVYQIRISQGTALFSGKIVLK